MPVDAQRRSRTSALAAATLVVGLIALLWALEIVDTVLGNRLDQFGVSPRDLAELPQIVTAPFLHAGFEHLTANTAPLAVLGFLAALRGLGRFVAVSVVVMLVSGLGVWLLAPPATVTLGASGLIFGYFSYVVVRGFLDGDLLGIAVGVVVALLYGSILWGVLPTSAAVSWQAHLFGLVGGALAAWALRARRLSAPHSGKAV